MDTTQIVASPALNCGLLILRLIVGLLIAAHGAQKLFGWFGGYGISGTGGYFESLGFHPGTLFATAAGFSEFTSGVLVALGLFGPIGPALMISVMLVAMLTVHRQNGIFAANNGIEMPLLYTAAAIALALTGWGRYSLDTYFGLYDFWTPTLVWIVLALGVVGGLANLGLRKAPPPAPPSTPSP